MASIIIGLTGKARAGKDSLALCLMSQYPEAVFDSFARPIRKFVASILGVSLRDLEKIKDEPSDILHGKTPRFAMQTLGTEWGRKTLFDDLWIEWLFRRNENAKLVVLADVRFDNEAQAIKERGGHIVRIVRKDHAGIGGDHASEMGVSDELVDFTVVNEGSLQDYLASAMNTLKTILPHYDVVDSPALRHQEQSSLF